MTPRRLQPLLALVALPVLMAPGRCGFIVDFTETVLIPDDSTRVVLDTDDGQVVATSYERQAILLKRHTKAFEPSIGPVKWYVEDTTVHLEAHCKYEGNCSFDHMLEVPLGISFEISMQAANIHLGYIGGDIDATFESGFFEGIRLESPNTRLELDDGGVSLDYAVAPESVVVALRDGDVELAVPPGAYRCNFEGGADVDTASEISCDAAATAVLDITVETGTITVKGAE